MRNESERSNNILDTLTNVNNEIKWMYDYFHEKQIQEILAGLATLNLAQVSVYAKPEYHSEQMEQARCAFEEGASFAEVEELLNYHSDHMAFIRTAKNKFNEDEVEILKKIPVDYLSIVYSLMLDGKVNIEKLNKVYKPNIHSGEELFELINGVVAGLTDDQLSYCSFMPLNMMDIVRDAFKRGVTEDQIRAQIQEHGYDDAMHFIIDL